MSLANKFGISQSLLDVVQASLDESAAYQAKVKAHMAKKGIKSLNDMSDEQKKSFFNELDAMHKAKNEEVEQVDELSNPTLLDYALKKHRTVENPKVKDRFQMAKAHARMDARSKGDSHPTHPVPKAYHDQHHELKKDEIELERSHTDAIKKHIASGGTHTDKQANKIHKDFHKKSREVLKKHRVIENSELSQEDLEFIASLNGTQIEEDFNLDDFSIEEIQEFMQTEEFDQLDELSKTTLGSYIKKRSHDVATQGALTRHHAEKSEREKKNPELGNQRQSMERADKAFAKGWKHRVNIGKAVDRLTKD